MGWIALENIRFHAHHGYYQEERLAGAEFILDIYIRTPFEKKASSDKLVDTINYETVYFICQKAMKQPAQLLEKVALEIMHGLKFQFGSMQAVRIRLRKMRPMPGERIGSAYIEVEEAFEKICPKCQSKFTCYSDANCWCMSLDIAPETLQDLRKQFEGCLCPDCLKIYGQS